jgi:hypothetical protein
VEREGGADIVRPLAAGPVGRANYNATARVPAHHVGAETVSRNAGIPMRG